jgi:hypothetical protein
MRAFSFIVITLLTFEDHILIQFLFHFRIAYFFLFVSWHNFSTSTCKGFSAIWLKGALPRDFGPLVFSGMALVRIFRSGRVGIRIQSKLLGSGTLVGGVIGTAQFRLAASLSHHQCLAVSLTSLTTKQIRFESRLSRRIRIYTRNNINQWVRGSDRVVWWKRSNISWQDP